MNRRNVEAKIGLPHFKFLRMCCIIVTISGNMCFGHTSSSIGKEELRDDTTSLILAVPVKIAVGAHAAVTLRKAKLLSPILALPMVVLHCRLSMVLYVQVCTFVLYMYNYYVQNLEREQVCPVTI